MSSPNQQDSSVSALGRYSQFYEYMITQDRWNREEIDSVARQHRVMLDAAIETINDWAFDALGATLIDDENDELVVDRSLL